MSLRAFCWTVALALGAAQAWATRFTMNPDGISYLDIGDAYWRHDWHNAINAYWSPLYSWILGLFVNVIKPSPYWEYPLVHLVNFLIYVATLASFEFFLTTFIEDRWREGRGDGLPEFFWRALGYSLYVTASLVLCGLNLATPDLALSGLVYIAAALVLLIRRGSARLSTYAALGVVLGIAYLAKAVMFPLAFVFLAAAYLSGDIDKHSSLRTVISVTMFFAITVPFIAAVSNKAHKLTFGDSGKINYEIEVQGDNWFIPPSLVAHTAEMHAVPSLSVFATPIPGTYALWYDPTYWHQGAAVEFGFKSQCRALLRGFRQYWIICTTAFLQLNITATLLICLLLARSRLRLKAMLQQWPVLVPCLVALLLYALVVVEMRYVAPFLLIVWLNLFCSIRIPVSKTKCSELVTVLCGTLMLTTVLITLIWTFAVRQLSTDKTSEALAAMRQQGLRNGDLLCVLGSKPEGEGGAFVARLGRMRVIAEIPNANEYWRSPNAAQHEVQSELARRGVRAILTHDALPPGSSFQPLGSTGYHLLCLGNIQPEARH